MNPVVCGRAVPALLASLRLLVTAGVALGAVDARSADAEFRLARFRADVTPDLGHPLLGGQFAPATALDDPLWAKGIVLLAPDGPIVLCAIDWCEIRNDAYMAWRSSLAEAAGTTVERVLVAAVHQHDAPLADLGAQHLLDQHAAGPLCDAEFHRRCVERVATALRASLASAEPVTHYAVGKAKVERIASNRRIESEPGKVCFQRYSTTADPRIRALPEGLIDPWRRTVCLFNGERPLVALSAYATHPMSSYGRGAISGDFVGLARERRERADPAVMQVYFSGCSGDVTAGKYNDGSDGVRAELTDRLAAAMIAASDNLERRPLERVVCRSASIVLPHRDTGGLAAAESQRTLADSSRPRFERMLAALGLSSRAHSAAGHAIDIQAIDFGAAQVVLLPGESFVGYQLLAQRLRPDQFIMAMGYGECSTGYLPTESAFNEGFAEEHGWCWVKPGAETIVAEGLRGALNVAAEPSRNARDADRAR